MKPEPAPPSRIEAFKVMSAPGTSGREFLSRDHSTMRAGRRMRATADNIALNILRGAR